MIVLDASAALELLLALPLGRAVEERVALDGWSLAAPQLLTVEVLQVMRRRVLAGVTALAVAEDGRRLLNSLDIHFFNHQILSERIWELRENVTAYDACYLALAEVLDAELLTADTRLARAVGHHARVTVLG